MEEKSSTSAAWWIPSYQRQHGLCKRKSIYRYLRFEKCCIGVILMRYASWLCLHIHAPRFPFLSDLYLSILWTNKWIKHLLCGPWIWRTRVWFKKKSQILTLLTLSFCHVLFKLAQCMVIYFVKTMSALDRVKWRIPSKRPNQTHWMRCWQKVFAALVSSPNPC